MKFLLIPLLYLCMQTQAFAGDGDYAVNKIPAALFVNANAVKRFEDIRFEVSDVNRARYYHKVVYTVLNEKGDKFAECQEYYDKLQSIESIEGRLYDENGKKIKSLRNSDVQDKTGTGDGNLADDNRIKYHNFYHKIYPYTVEYEVVMHYNYTMSYPGWIALDGENISLESGTMSVTLPEALDFRYKAFNYPREPALSKQKGNKTYTWELKNQPAVQYEYASPGWYEITPVICMAPVQFAIQGYSGNMSSWRDFGKFVYALNNGRDQLPDNIKKAVHDLADAERDTTKKIAALYEFLQKNSRYVSVQLGLGGWQPFDAKYVASNRYGDCKALSNYMYSLLKEAGIKSFYTVIKSGTDKLFFMAGFPSLQFNHAILCVPVHKDTVWLECTSQTLPAGYLSGFTSDRNALIIDENGGTLVKTPRYSMKDNLQTRRIKAAINEEGQLASDVETVYRARQQDQLHSLITSYSKDKIAEYLKAEIDLPNYDVLNFNYKEEPSRLPSITETLKLTSNNYAQVSGRRLFVCPNILSRSHRVLSGDSTRKYDIDITYAYTDVDTVEIKIPTGYKPEALPKNASISSSFGRYATSVEVTEDKITYFRKMERISGRFPASQYDELVNFNNQVYKADNSKMVFVKKE